MIHPKARSAGLFTEEIGNEAIVYDQERKIAHRLNPTLALVWKNCDGSKTVSEIAAILKQELNEVADENLVRVSLNQLDSIHLLEEPAKISLMEAHIAASICTESGSSRCGLVVVATRYHHGGADTCAGSHLRRRRTVQ